MDDLVNAYFNVYGCEAIQENFGLLGEKRYVVSETKEGKIRATFLPTSRERDIGIKSDWNDPHPDTLNWGEKTPRGKALVRRARAVIGTQRRQDNETDLKQEELEYLLDLLVTEGYTDSYESAACVLEELSDEDIEWIVEKYVKANSPTNKGRDWRAGRYGPGEPPRRRKPVPDKWKWFEGDFDRTLSGKYPQARKRKDIRRQGVGGFVPEELEYLLDLLVTEGYTDSYESAACILEAMSDEWLDQLLENSGMTPANRRTWERLVRERGPHPWTDPQVKPRRAKKNEEPVNEANIDEEVRPGQLVRGYNRASLQNMTARRLNVSGSPFRSKTAKNKMDNTNVTAANAQAHYWRTSLNKEELDYILDLLVTEGYTNSYESAACILEAMSDEWFNSLIEARMTRSGGKTREERERMSKILGKIARDQEEIQQDIQNTPVRDLWALYHQRKTGKPQHRKPTTKLSNVRIGE